ncbi:unnamed protein product [Larinioides sclopetarius]|uniref:Uncharacterized protein n=1 Tax=Larinioides sclopetarius TaxID=280406 RepID=A0AAV2BY28_9ARAC
MPSISLSVFEREMHISWMVLFFLVMSAGMAPTSAIAQSLSVSQGIDSSVECPSGWYRCPSGKRCIPSQFVCSVRNECDRSITEETNCENKTTKNTFVTSPEISFAKAELKSWFLRRKKPGPRTDRWGSQIHRIAVALHLADNSTFSPGNRTGEEISYELTTQLLYRLGKDKKMSSQELALYLHALLVACMDPRDFYGEDLIRELRKRVEASGNYTNPFLILVLCNVGDDMTTKDVERERNDRQLPDNRTRHEEEEAVEKVLEVTGETMTVHYCVCMGEEINVGRTWRLKLLVNSTIYNAIETVAKMDNRQKVQYNVVDGKPYVSALNGKEDDPEMGMFWFLHLKFLSSEKNPKLVEESPVDIKLQPNQEIILWYKRAPWSGHSPMKKSVASP